MVEGHARGHKLRNSKLLHANGTVRFVSPKGPGN